MTYFEIFHCLDKKGLASSCTESGFPCEFCKHWKTLFLRSFILKAPERAQIFLKNGTRDFKNSSRFARQACFYVTISRNFERLQYLTLKQIFWKTKTFFKKLSAVFQLKELRLKAHHFHAILPYQKPMLRQIEW